MQLSRSEHHFVGVAKDLRNCWIPFCAAAATAAGSSAVDWRVTPSRVTPAISLLLADPLRPTWRAPRTDYA